MREWLYTVNPEAEEPIMLINQHIGFDEEEGWGIRGYLFQSELMFLDTLGKKRIKIFINSKGGSVLEGYNIFSSIITSKTPVDTYNVGIAASIAGIIFQAGCSRYCFDYTLNMIHSPSNGDDKTLNKIQESLISMIETRNRKNLTVERIKDDMIKETWYNAKESIDSGLADAIVNIKDLNIPERMPTENVMDYCRKVQHVLNSYKETKSQSTQMKKIADILNLAPEASEGSILTSIESIKNDLKDSKEKLDGKEKELTKITNELQTAKDEIATLKKAADEAAEEKKTKDLEDLTNKATMAVDGYIKEGRIKNEKEVKEGWVKQFIADFDGAKKLADGLPLNKGGLKVVDHMDGGDKGPIKRTAGSIMFEIANKHKQI